MRIIESFRMKPEYSVSTIIEESKADESLINEISEYIQTWSFLKHMPKLGPSKIILSNKAGPNGPATITAIEDLTALRQNEPELLAAIREALVSFKPDLEELMDMYESHEGSFQASKLVLLSDKACKTRIIAIADWWSNMALESLHRAFMGALSKLPSDVTYRQNEIPNLVKGLGPHLYSSDMTAFTDRFPRVLEETLIEAAYGATMSRLWTQIVSNRTFHHPEGGVRYVCGNPMGLLSSWPVSTLTHHAVKQWCAYKVGEKGYHKGKYLILGDDTLDTSKEVYEKYIETINALGVSISPAKSTVSEIGNTEFAKRLFINNVEVTGLPVHILEDIQHMPEQVLELVRICRERGYEDNYLGPSLTSILSSSKNKKMILDMLSLPETVTGVPPLEGVTPGDWAELLLALSGEDLEKMISIARNNIFWSTAVEANKLDTSKKVYRLAVDPYHPLTFALSEMLEKYIDGDINDEVGDEYSIYNAWMRGEYRELGKLPSLDVYRARNRGHKATKAKYDVLKTLLRLASGDQNVPLYKTTRLSDLELFDLGLELIRTDYTG
jgi:hypothetical protein